MASEGNSWPLVRSEDLPEGLSDRGKGDHSSEETLSVSGSSRVVGSEDSLVARSYPSSISHRIHLLLSVRPLGVSQPLLADSSVVAADLLVLRCIGLLTPGIDRYS
uniref:Uncharacterized protein n=1 Tax=Fagus sylvatica TaxID=28930 RepID=A0A2N9HB13_FAGSY